MIEIDGSMGEGGGQVLRSGLSLSLLTGQALTVSNIRANRTKPGLRPQHLAAVQAAGRISAAAVEGDRVGSRRITFIPATVTAGDYHFDIGTAGATALVLQTLLLPLAAIRGPSRLSISGGTHVPWSPCFHYLDWHWRVLLFRLGIRFELALGKAGFYPAGGGELLAGIPGGAQPTGLDLQARGRLQRIRGTSAVANLPLEIAARQRRQTMKRLKMLAHQVDMDVTVESLPGRSRGTLLLLLAEFEQSQACFFALGELGKPAECVADEAVDELFKFLSSDGAVDPWLADQLLLPLSLAKQASIVRTSRVTQHLLTNAELIGQFLPVHISIDGSLEEAAMVRLRP